MEDSGDSMKVLVDFEDTLIKILDGLHHKLRAVKPPDSIYHYTNDTGLHGILESGTLRLSNIFSLNDPTELSHGMSHAVDILRSGPPALQEFAEKFSRFCQDGIKSSAHYYVCSFSWNGDDLGQWRAYSDNGRGYVLEFDANKLASDFSSGNGGSEQQRNSTFQITYADQELIEIHRQFIAPFIPLLSLPREKDEREMPPQEFMTNLSAILSMYALEAALYFKHEAYKNESEFRFLQIFERNAPMPDLKWRVRLNELVAYREFVWRDTQPRMLKRIIIGPAANRSKAERFIKECLTAYHPENHGKVEIAYSEIPYRAVTS